MKLKLKGLLLFSQVAAQVNRQPFVPEQVNRIDSKNYRDNFCDESLFEPVHFNENVGTRANNDPVTAEDYRRTKLYHDMVCTTRLQYEQALKEDPGTGTSIQAGMYYAGACNNAKRFKNDVNNVYKWNEVMPTVAPCKPKR